MFAWTSALPTRTASASGDRPSARTPPTSGRAIIPLSLTRNSPVSESSPNVIRRTTSPGPSR